MATILNKDNTPETDKGGNTNSYSWLVGMITATVEDGLANLHKGDVCLP